ncbi:MAG: sigma-70 factor domain-containing protein, partial [Acidimicrobiales bacterium]
MLLLATAGGTEVTRPIAQGSGWSAFVVRERTLMGIAAEDVLGQYLVDIRRHRLLTKQDEVRLSQAVEAGQRAAAELEAAAEDIVVQDGKFSVRGSPETGMALADVAGIAYIGAVPEGLEPGLEETTFYDPENFVFPFGAHA